MKKILLLIISIILAMTMLVGCGNKTKALDNVGGEVYSGNGTFAVEKGDYVYFINGKESVTATNKFGKVEKASLVRVSKADLASPKTAKIEMVIPKILVSNSYKTGVYIFGNYVYFATPSDRKDKQSNVMNDQTLFYRFNLENGKLDSKHIAVATDNSTEYRFIEKDGTVYLAFVDSTKVDEENSTKKLMVYNADKRELVYESFEYEEMLMPEDNSDTFYLTRFAYDELNEADKDYQDIYKYVIGSTEPSIAVSGDPSLEDSGMLQGATFTLVKNTGNYLIYKKSALDTTNASVTYNAIDKSGVKTSLGGKNTYIEAVFASTCYVESLNAIYYMDTTTELSGFVKFDYTKVIDADMTNGRTPICLKAKSYTFNYVENGYAYFSSAEGMYYRCLLDGTKFSQINGVAMKTSTDWYAPRVIGNYFIGSYSADIYSSYVYVVDMTNIENEEVYSEYLEDIATDDEEHVLKLIDTRIAIVTEADSSAFDNKLKELYP